MPMGKKMEWNFKLLQKMVDQGLTAKTIALRLGISTPSVQKGFRLGKIVRNKKKEGG